MYCSYIGYFIRLVRCVWLRRDIDRLLWHWYVLRDGPVANEKLRSHNKLSHNHHDMINIIVIRHRQQQSAQFFFYFTPGTIYISLAYGDVVQPIRYSLIFVLYFYFFLNFFSRTLYLICLTEMAGEKNNINASDCT